MSVEDVEDDEASLRSHRLRDLNDNQNYRELGREFRYATKRLADRSGRNTADD